MNKQQKIKHWQDTSKQQRSDLSIIQFCRDNKINLSRFYAWRKHLSDISKRTAQLCAYLYRK